MNEYIQNLFRDFEREEEIRNHVCPEIEAWQFKQNHPDLSPEEIAF